MIRAYNEIYLERVRCVMAHMFDYAVHGLGYNISDFFECFLVSQVCEKFERGDAFVVAGKSGVELAYEVTGTSDNLVEPEDAMATMHRSKEFWLGWALAYIGWY